MINTIDFTCFSIVDSKVCVLLKRRSNENEPAFNEFTLIGGMVWEQNNAYLTFDTSLDEARDRIFKDKVGLDYSYMEQLPSVGSINRDSRGWTVTTPYLCFINEKLSLDDDSKWVSVHDIISGKFKLPFDHQKIVKKSLDTLNNKATYSSIILYMLPIEFIISELVELYKTFDLDVSKQTVHNRFVKGNIIFENGEKRKGANGGKPALVYKVNNDKISFFDSTIGLK
jgi:8-oxo-dGTP diphosphatase